MKNSILTEYNEKYVLDQLSQESYEDGVKAGRKLSEKIGRDLGEKRLAVLAQKMLADNRFEEFFKATTDKSYRQKLYEEYGL